MWEEDGYASDDMGTQAWGVWGGVGGGRSGEEEGGERYWGGERQRLRLPHLTEGLRMEGDRVEERLAMLRALRYNPETRGCRV